MSECCVNSPMRLLRGVTRTVTLTIKDASGVPLDLSAVELTVEVIRDGSADKYVPTIAVEGEAHNLIVFTWPADKQKVGLHTIDVRGDFGVTGVSRTNWHGPDGIVIVEWARDTSAREVADLSVEEVSMTGTMETAAAASGGNYYVKPEGGIPASDIADGVIPDVSNFVTNTVNDLVNYYLKSETYTKTEVDTLIGAIQGFEYVVVSSLPTASADTMGKIYLVPSATSATHNVKDEYITLRVSMRASSFTYTWEQIGSTAIDLSDYVTEDALNTALSAYTTSAELETILEDYVTGDALETLLEEKQSYDSGTAFPDDPQEGDVFVLTSAYVHDIDSSELSTSGFFQDPYLYYTGGVRGTLRIQLATSESTPGDCWVNAGEYYEFQNYSLQSFTVPNTISHVAFLNSEENRMFATSVLSFQYPAGVYEYDGNGWTPRVTGENCVAWNNKYEKPYNGIPKADLASAVQASLGKADTAYQKPSGGIPTTDLVANKALLETTTVPNVTSAGSASTWSFSVDSNNHKLTISGGNGTAPTLGTTKTVATGNIVTTGLYKIPHVLYDGVDVGTSTGDSND